MNEFSLIYNHFQHLTQSHHNTILGIGDDCAISTIPSHVELVSCVDTLIAGRHFPYNTRPYAIAWKAIAVNLSDIASMGAKPYAILLALSLPQNNELWIQEFARGLAEICHQFNVELIGGDTTKSDLLTISVTALGLVETGKAIQRNGAKIGDLICVSGHIGSASLALSHILNGQNTHLQHTLDLPIPQVILGQKLVDYTNSMIDISDGLAQDLGHILQASHVGAKLYLENIPCSDELNALSFEQKYHHILNGGDDYQLCFTMTPENFIAFNQKYPHLIYPIGEIITGQGLQLFYQQQYISFNIQGWQHF